MMFGNIFQHSSTERLAPPPPPPQFWTDDILEPSKQALLASRDVIISSQICGSKLQRAFTLGDRYWLPKEKPQFYILNMIFRDSSGTL